MMKDDIKELLIEIEPCDQIPVITANDIDIFVSRAMREGKINLYEGYLLNGESIRIERAGGIWSINMSIKDCIKLLNQKLLSSFFQNEAAVNTYRKWGLEVYTLCTKNRPHYIMDQYLAFMEPEVSRDLLEYLYRVRVNYDTLSFDEGPYHCESFPYDYSTEKLLLEGADYHEYMKLSPDIEDLVVELNINFS